MLGFKLRILSVSSFSTPKIYVSLGSYKLLALILVFLLTFLVIWNYYFQQLVYTYLLYCLTELFEFYSNYLHLKHSFYEDDKNLNSKLHFEFYHLLQSFVSLFWYAIYYIVYKYNIKIWRISYWFSFSILLCFVLFSSSINTDIVC